MTRKELKDKLWEFTRNNTIPLLNCSVRKDEDGEQYVWYKVKLKYSTWTYGVSTIFTNDYIFDIMTKELTKNNDWI